MATNFWSGDKAEFLLNKLKLKSGTQVISTDEDPRITSIDANKGSIAEFNGKWYRKQDDGDTTAWSQFVGFSDDSIYEVFNAEYGDLTDFTNTTINTTTPISGLADYSVTSFPAETPVVTLDPARVNSSDGSVTFRYTLASGTVKAVVYDQDSNEVVSLELEANTAKRARLEWTPKNTQTSYQLIFGDVSSGTGLFYDSVVYSDSPREVKEFTVANSISLSGNDGRVIANNAEDVPFNGSGTGWTSGADNEPNFYTPQYEDSIIDLNVSVIYNANVGRPFIYLFKNGIQYKELIDTGLGASLGSVKGTYLSKKGEFLTSDELSIRAKGGTLSNSTFAHYLNITETATKEGTVYGSDEPVDARRVEGSGTSMTSIVSNVTDVTFTEVYDALGEWTSSTTFTPKTSGAYSIAGNILVNASAATVVNLYADGVFKNTIQSNPASSTQPFNRVVYLEAGVAYTLRMSHSSTLSLVNDPSHEIEILKNEGNVDNFIVDVGTKHVSGGEEYPTGDTLNGKPIYARTWIVGSDITVSGNVITGLPTNITPFGLNNYTSDYWLIYESGFSTSLSRVDYRKSSGVIYAEFSGTRKVGAGTVIYFPYTYDD